MTYQWRQFTLVRSYGEEKNMLIFNTIPKILGNENSTYLFKEPNIFYTPICNTSRLLEFLESGSKCYFQESFYNMNSYLGS